ncbi:unnamed protein product, partial [Polarella glacialis]
DLHTLIHPSGGAIGRFLPAPPAPPITDVGTVFMATTVAPVEEMVKATTTVVMAALVKAAAGAAFSENTVAPVVAPVLSRSSGGDEAADLGGSRASTTLVSSFFGSADGSSYLPAADETESTEDGYIMPASPEMPIDMSGN